MATAARTEKLDLRLTPAAKRSLQLAAATVNKSVSEFVVESALERAEDILPDQTKFTLNAQQWEAFHALLDAPPRLLPRMMKLLSEPSVFEIDEQDADRQARARP